MNNERIDQIIDIYFYPILQLIPENKRYSIEINLKEIIKDISEAERKSIIEQLINITK